MHDEACVCFLQWALPQLHMRWPGFRKVYGQVCKRIRRRILELDLNDVVDYRYYLQQHAEEWTVLDALVRVTISRFYRDKMMFVFLQQQVLPDLCQQAIAAGHNSLNIWSVGCGSGEEPYTLAIIWQLHLQQRFPDLNLHIVATDVDAALCQRAEDASYSYGSIKNLPSTWREQVFVQVDEQYLLKPEYRQNCVFRVEDVRKVVPTDRFQLVLCRNLVFTYFDEIQQGNILERMKTVINKDGALVIGIHESLPARIKGFSTWHEKLRVFRKIE